MSEAGDTFDRSLVHWSEGGRAEMDLFYRVATLDYRELATAWDWAGWFQGRLAGCDAPLRVLDVACGSGKFPTALREHTSLGELDGTPIHVDLLDPAPFSLREARAALAPPMVPGRSFACTLQALPRDATGYAMVWAVHALYALPADELPAGVDAFLRALAPDGLGFVGHATRDAHYLRFYEAYRAGRRPDATPYTSAEAVEAAFRRAGAHVDARRVRYHQRIDDPAVLEGFLQRCLFDRTLTLEAMRRDAHLGPYLAARREGNAYRFEQEALMLFIRR
ncbi:MAG: class I SAM-dependent methyltransferase [Sandaracinaceae bacterium]